VKRHRSVGLVLLICLVIVVPACSMRSKLPEQQNSPVITTGFPLKAKWDPIILPFGYWVDERPGPGYHLGEDVPRDSETAVYPISSGVVKLAMYLPNAGIGYAVILEHEFGGNYFCSVSYHMREPRIGEELAEGKIVYPDKPIGYISGTPQDHQFTVPHIHFGIREGKFRTDYPDPRTSVWFYPGYTTTYLSLEAKSRQEPVKDRDYPTHNAILNEWVAPSDFIRKYQRK